MRLTKYTHACVRFERDGAVLVIDPGVFSEAAALDGADAVLITHEHPDHLDVDKLTAALERRPQTRVYTHPAVAEKLSGLGSEVVQQVEAATDFTAAGFQIRAYGGAHAVIHPDIPRIANLGYLVEGSVYHPGDSVTDVPDRSVETLLLPVNAPWLKLAESVDFARAVAPRRAYALHDHLLSDAGAKIYHTNLARLAGCEYQHLEPGTTVTA